MNDDRLTALQTIRQRLCTDSELWDINGDVMPFLSDFTLVETMREDGSWADVSLDDPHPKRWAAVDHLDRLRALARSWCQPISPLAGNDAVREAVLRGLDCWYTHDPQPPQWWWREIGQPLLLGETLLCMKDVCDPSYITRARPAFTVQGPIYQYAAENGVWVAWTHILYGLITDDPKLVAKAYEAISNITCYFQLGEGIRADQSFQMHGALLYSGGYGAWFAADVSRLVAAAAGTAYAWPSHPVDRLTAYVLDGCRWMVRGRTFDPGVIGREIARSGHSAGLIYSALRYLASLDHSRQAEVHASTVVDRAEGRSLVTGNRHFWCSDFMAHHRPDYYMSVRLTSSRLLNTDCPYGGEGRRNLHMADGATFLMRDGDEYRDLYPAWNWRHIPGTTVTQVEGELDQAGLSRPGERDFAGGASDGQVGCAAMDFSRDDLQARKAWFLFDDGMVALGADIRATANAPVRTTLNQCHWRGPTYLTGVEGPLVAGEYPLEPGASCWHDGLTYHVIDGKGTLRLGPQSGAWSDIGEGSPNPVTCNVFDAGIDHGLHPIEATYAYIVLPDLKITPVENDPKRFVIVTNTPALQAVWHRIAQRGHAVLYQPGTVVFPDGQHITVDRPCILLYHPHEDGSTELTIAQSEQLDGLIHLRLERHRQYSLRVSLPPQEYAGSSMTILIER